MAEQTVATTTAQPATTTNKEGTRAQERYMQPPVDIYDTPDGLVLLADLPGVATDGLTVRIEDNTLTIVGKAKHAFTGEPIFCEFELHNFFRQFELSEEVDQGKINAKLKHGVLTLQLPRAEKAKPRQIAIQVD